MSARAANASAPRGSVCTGTPNAGISHGRLNSGEDDQHAREPPAALPRRRVPRSGAATTAPSPATLMAANPPTAAGIAAISSRPGRVRAGPVLSTLITHGSAA